MTRKSWVVRVRSIDYTRILGVWGGALHGGFLRDPSLYLREFQSKPNGKIRTTRSTSATGIEISMSSLSVLCAELLCYW